MSFAGLLPRRVDEPLPELACLACVMTKTHLGSPGRRDSWRQEGCCQVGNPTKVLIQEVRRFSIHQGRVGPRTIPPRFRNHLLRHGATRPGCESMKNSRALRLLMQFALHCILDQTDRQELSALAPIRPSRSFRVGNQAIAIIELINFCGSQIESCQPVHQWKTKPAKGSALLSLAGFAGTLFAFP